MKKGAVNIFSGLCGNSGKNRTISIGRRDYYAFSFRMK